MKIKIPPPIVAWIFAGLMYLSDRVLPVGEFDFFGRDYLIYGLTVLGGFVLAASMLRFFISRTTLNPFSPERASRLVTKGLYKFSRNPMYLALLLFLLAWGLWLGNAFNTLLAAGFVSYMNRFQILHEEKALTQRFGKEYQLYCKNVRRWF
ncbi:MAG: methyltransferase family protein [Aurantibacter sp.]